MASAKTRSWVPDACATCQLWSLSTEGGSRCMAASQGPGGSRLVAVGSKPETECLERVPVEWSKTVVAELEARYRKNPKFFQSVGVTPADIEAMKRPKPKPPAASPSVVYMRRAALPSSGAEVKADVLHLDELEPVRPVPAKRPSAVAKPAAAPLPTSKEPAESPAPKITQAAAGKRPPAAASAPPPTGTEIPAQKTARPAQRDAQPAQPQPPKLDPRRRPPVRPKT